MALVEGYQLKPINRTDEDFKYINSRMIKTLSVHHNNGVKLESYEITQVFKVWNSKLWRQYSQRRDEIFQELGAKEFVKEKRLFHGTPYAKKISQEGFDTVHAKPTGMFGKGIYFAENSSKSVQYAYGLNNGCEKHSDRSCYECARYMLVCRVALGNMLETKVAIQPTTLPTGYHSVHAVPSDGGLKYPEYVIYNNHQDFLTQINTIMSGSNYNITNRCGSRHSYDTRNSDGKNHGYFFKEPKQVILPYVESPDCPEGAERWKRINAVLRSLISNPEANTVNHLIKVILHYNSGAKSYWKFDALETVIKEVLMRDERIEFLSKILPRMAEIALNLPMLMDGKSLNLLKKGANGHHKLTKQQVASLLANAFFCTFPRRNDPNGQFENYPTINFSGLYQYYHGRAEKASEAKLLCLINYFKQVTSNPPVGYMTFTRKCVKDFPDWKCSKKLMQEGTVKIQNHGTIERNGKDMLQVTFANRKFGGGVLDSGSVQEEVRCITCPEMIVARLFAEAFEDNEAFFVFGVECYSHHSGYASTFTFGGNFEDTVQISDHASIVAIDAINFTRSLYSLGIKKDDIWTKENKSREWVSGKLESYEHYRKTNTMHVQYHPKMINRELGKAYIGFKNHTGEPSPSPVATGNWGCGAYQGDPILKFLLQFMATSESERCINYFTFGDTEVTSKIKKLVSALEENQCTVGILYVILIEYHKSKDEFFEYLMKCLKQYSPNTPLKLNHLPPHGYQLDSKHFPALSDKTQQSHYKRKAYSVGFPSQAQSSSCTDTPDLNATMPSSSTADFYHDNTHLQTKDYLPQRESKPSAMEEDLNDANPQKFDYSPDVNHHWTDNSQTVNHHFPAQTYNQSPNTNAAGPAMYISPPHRSQQRSTNDSSGVSRALFGDYQHTSVQSSTYTNLCFTTQAASRSQHLLQHHNHLSQQRGQVFGDDKSQHDRRRMEACQHTLWSHRSAINTTEDTPNSKQNHSNTTGLSEGSSEMLEGTSETLEGMSETGYSKETMSNVAMDICSPAQHTKHESSQKLQEEEICFAESKTLEMIQSHIAVKGVTYPSFDAKVKEDTDYSPILKTDNTTNANVIDVPLKFNNVTVTVPFENEDQMLKNNDSFRNISARDSPCKLIPLKGIKELNIPQKQYLVLPVTIDKENSEGSEVPMQLN